MRSHSWVVAKVTASLPDELLATIDAAARPPAARSWPRPRAENSQALAHKNGWPTAEEVIAGKAERDMSR